MSHNVTFSLCRNIFTFNSRPSEINYNFDFRSFKTNLFIHSFRLPIVSQCNIFSIICRRILSNSGKICVLQNSVYKSSTAKVAKGTAMGSNIFIGNRYAVHSVQVF